MVAGVFPVNFRIALALLVLLSKTTAAPVQIMLPDVVTFPNGNTITLYSPQSSFSRDDPLLQTDADEAVISIDQDMLLHALADTDAVSSVLDSSSMVSQQAHPARMPYDHSKNLDVVAQLLDNDNYDAIDDDLTNSSTDQSSISTATKTLKTSRHGVSSSTTSSYTMASGSTDSESSTPTSSHTTLPSKGLLGGLVNTSHTKT
ncbi:hypothetical protein J3B02_003584, partial [Coemansia erecta]